MCQTEMKKSREEREKIYFTDFFLDLTIPRGRRCLELSQKLHLSKVLLTLKKLRREGEKIICLICEIAHKQKSKWEHIKSIENII